MVSNEWPLPTCPWPARKVQHLLSKRFLPDRGPSSEQSSEHRCVHVQKGCCTGGHCPFCPAFEGGRGSCRPLPRRPARLSSLGQASFREEEIDAVWPTGHGTHFIHSKHCCIPIAVLGQRGRQIPNNLVCCTCRYMVVSASKRDTRMTLVSCQTGQVKLFLFCIDHLCS